MRMNSCEHIGVLSNKVRGGDAFLVEQLVSNAAILLAGFYIISLVYKEPITKELSTNKKNSNRNLGWTSRFCADGFRDSNFE